MLPPRSASRNFLPPEGDAAPAVWQSQSRGPCSNGEAPSYSLSLRERAGASRCGSRRACAGLDSVKRAGLRPACGLQDRGSRSCGPCRVDNPSSARDHPIF